MKLLAAFVLVCLSAPDSAFASIEDSYRVFLTCDPSGALAEKFDFGSSILATALAKTSSPASSKADRDTLEAVINLSIKLDSVKSCEESDEALGVLRGSLKMIGEDMDSLLANNRVNIEMGASTFVRAYSSQP